MDYQFSLRLPAPLAKKLDRAALRMQRKRSEVVRSALEQFPESAVAVRPIPESLPLRKSTTIY